MKVCLHCGENCNDDVNICPKCGALVEEYIDHKTYMDVYHVNHGKRIKNYRLILWFLLGLILPYISFLVCWIMYDSDRSKAKAVLLGAIVSTLVATFLPYILMMFVGDSSDTNNDNNGNYSGGQQIRNLIGIYKCL